MRRHSKSQNTDKRPHPQRTDEMHPVLCAHQAWAGEVWGWEVSAKLQQSTEVSCASSGHHPSEAQSVAVERQVAVPARLVVLVPVLAMTFLCPSSR